MSLLEWLAIAVTIVTVFALIKRYETRLVLFTAGLDWNPAIPKSPEAITINAPLVEQNTKLS